MTIGSPGRIEITATAARVFVVDDMTGVAAYAIAERALAWTASLSTDLAPAAAADTLYLAAGTTLHALNEATGSPRWAREVGGPIVALAADATGPLTASGRIVRAWLAEGSARWESTLPADVTRGLLAADETFVYVVLTDQSLVWLDRTTGVSRKALRLEAMPRAITVDRGAVYFGGADQTLYAYSQHGRQWAFRKVDVIGAPAVDERQVYVLTWDNNAVAFDRSNGGRRWRAGLGGRPARGPWLAGDDLVASLTSTVLALVPRSTGPTGPRPAPTVGPPDFLLTATPSADRTQAYGVIALTDGSRRLVAYAKIK